MIDVGELVDDYVAILQGMTGLLTLLDGVGATPGIVYAYQDEYPEKIQIQLAIQQMLPPSIMVAYAGTGRGDLGGIPVASHRLIAYLKAKQNWYDILRLMASGTVAAQGCKIGSATIHPDCDAMSYGVAQIDRIPAFEKGQPDMFVVQMSFNEIGDN